MYWNRSDVNVISQISHCTSLTFLLVLMEMIRGLRDERKGGEWRRRGDTALGYLATSTGTLASQSDNPLLSDEQAGSIYGVATMDRGTLSAHSSEPRAT